MAKRKKIYFVKKEQENLWNCVTKKYKKVCKYIKKLPVPEEDNARKKFETLIALAQPYGVSANKKLDIIGYKGPQRQPLIYEEQHFIEVMKNESIYS